MDKLTLFGLISVVAMVTFYSLEHRSRWYVFAFAISGRVGLRIYAAGIVGHVWSLDEIVGSGTGLVRITILESFVLVSSKLGC
jgi:hypothetical protein